uniref:Uncharacterized protein n=1 Tax=Anguilla anguilla TaxID=7936 RepID=A0A0E9UF95_ANGAN
MAGSLSFCNFADACTKIPLHPVLPYVTEHKEHSA